MLMFSLSGNVGSETFNGFSEDMGIKDWLSTDEGAENTRFSFLSSFVAPLNSTFLFHADSVAKINDGWDFSLLISMTLSLSVSERKFGNIGVMEHLDNGDGGKKEAELTVVLGANAWSSKGELVVEVAVDNIHGDVIGVIGRKEKLFEEYFAGFIVVEGTGRRVILKGKDWNMV
jgi:hypothetical protein